MAPILVGFLPKSFPNIFQVQLQLSDLCERHRMYPEAFRKYKKEIYSTYKNFEHLQNTFHTIKHHYFVEHYSTLKYR